MGAGLCHWRVIIGFRGVASLALRRDRHAGVVLVTVRTASWRVALCVFGRQFSCWCYSAHDAIEAIHAAHRTLCPEIGPAVEMDVHSPEYGMYRDLSVQLPGMPYWPFSKRRDGLKLLDGAVRVECYGVVLDGEVAEIVVRSPKVVGS